MLGILGKKMSAEDAAFEDIGKCGDVIIKAAKSKVELGNIERDFNNATAVASVVTAIGKAYPNLKLGPDSAFSVGLGLIERKEFDQLNQFVLEMGEHLGAIRGYINRGLRIAEWYAGPVGETSHSRKAVT
jgi:hypothetical protein